MYSRRPAFTLVELMIVMVIIGILLSLILRAYTGGVRTAELKATEALIAKLEQAMVDRMDALSTYRADPTLAHYTMAAIYNGSNPRIESVARAQAIAQFDYLRAQLPDVFVVQSNTNYPLNFAGMPYGPGSTPVEYGYQLPLGNSVTIANGGSWDGTTANFNSGTGIFGASYEIAGGIYKQLGYLPQGYDGNDNDLDGLVDESGEGTNAAILATVTAKLAKHTHKTARAEMLYAILVEGGGPFGSSFDKDDFTAKEVQDTDGDGLMEFVDAWGEPLQFYRWPVLYRSDSQKGFPDFAKLTLDASLGQTAGPYSSVYEAREQNPLDPNQTLMAPAWWGSGFNNNAPAPNGPGGAGLSSSARTFIAHFGPCIVDPTARHAGAASNATFWDRSTTTANGYYARRAYYSRPLILSAGPDKIPGVAQLGVDYRGTDERTVWPTTSGNAPTRDGSGAMVPVAWPPSVEQLLLEGQGGKVDLNRTDWTGTPDVLGGGTRNDTNTQLEYYGQDDISNQMLQATGGVTQ